MITAVIAARKLMHPPPSVVECCPTSMAEVASVATTSKAASSTSMATSSSKAVHNMRVIVGKEVIGKQARLLVVRRQFVLMAISNTVVLVQ